MKTLFLQCNMGAAGDMLMAALWEICPDREGFIKKMGSLMPGVAVTPQKSEKCGIWGTHMDVSINGAREGEHGHEHGHEHHHHHIRLPWHKHSHSHNGARDIYALIDGFDLPESVKTDAKSVYALIAEAEAAAHAKPVEQVHFHEVGALDAVADVTGVCLLMDMIAPDEVVVSPVNVGSGFVKCAHGILPVPAPATAHILSGAPTYSGEIRSELCTPTGAALLRHFASRFSGMPPMTAEKTGYGMGKKNFKAANCVRAFLGEAFSENPSESAASPKADVYELKANIDDMTAEDMGLALDILMENGALDACFIPAVMKKSRPGHILLCLCKNGDQDALAALMLRHTSTIGVRKTPCERYVMERRAVTAATPYGDIRVKLCQGYGVKKAKPEYDDVVSAARLSGAQVSEIRRAAMAALDGTENT